HGTRLIFKADEIVRRVRKGTSRRMLDVGYNHPRSRGVLHSNIKGQRFEEDALDAKLKVYTTSWCGDCKVTKKLLEQLEIAFEEINIEDDAEAAEVVVRLNDGRRSVPTLVYDGLATSLSNFNRGRLEAFLQRHDLLAAQRS